jgi:hypothetical protein
MEDINAPEVVRSPLEVPGVNHEENITADDISQPLVRQAGMRRACRSKKNGNWTTEHFSNAIAAHDNGMNMKKASELFNIPYSSFREHCYGMRTSRVREAKGVFSSQEEQLLSNWLLTMVDRGYGLSPTTLRMKVSEITMSRATPFTEGIPRRGWKRRRPELTLHASQVLETARARGLFEDNVKSFYDNLQTLYSMHNYSPDRIWNCDESGAQARKNRGGVVIARTGAHRVHSIVPDQRNWLSVLVCINVAGLSIPSFYIFRGKRFGQNYIQRYELGTTMAMQPRV